MSEALTAKRPDQDYENPVIVTVDSTREGELFKSPSSDIDKLREGLGITALGGNVVGLVQDDKGAHYIDLNSNDFGTLIEEQSYEHLHLPPTEVGVESALAIPPVDELESAKGAEYTSSYPRTVQSQRELQALLKAASEVEGLNVRNVVIDPEKRKSWKGENNGLIEVLLISSGADMNAFEEKFKEYSKTDNSEK